jgi:tungstate transport system ATP-binding protein
MNPRHALLRLQDIRVVRAQRTVLDIAEFALAPAEIVALRGANGAGKTTMLKLLAGLLQATRCHWTLLGTPLEPRLAARYCRGRHVYLHQVPYMFEGTVIDNLAYGLTVRGRDHATRRVEIQAALAWAGLEALATRRAKSLSLGEQQRVALTRAKVLAPPVLLLDEITANLDGENRRRTYHLIAELKRGGTSVVFASHDPEAVAAHADRHLELVAGTLHIAPEFASGVVPLRPPAAGDRHDSR